MIPIAEFLERVRQNAMDRLGTTVGMAMFAPVYFSDQANKLLNEALEDSGDNLSVALGKQVEGETRVLYFGGNYSNAPKEHMIRSLERLALVPHTTTLLTEPGIGARAAPVFATVRRDKVFMAHEGEIESFFSFAAKELGVERIEGNASARSKPDFSLLVSGLLYVPSNNELVGSDVKLIGIAWDAILDELLRDNTLFYKFSKYPRQFEEFIATSYQRAGFHVELTPRSGDGGVDIIAERHGLGAVRILDQTKAFASGRRVDANDVRALMGTLSQHSNASKAIMTTTSDFAPRVREEWRQSIPFRLELRDGRSLLDWLADLRDRK